MGRWWFASIGALLEVACTTAAKPPPADAPAAHHGPLRDRGLQQGPRRVHGAPPGCLEDERLRVALRRVPPLPGRLLPAEGRRVLHRALRQERLARLRAMRREVRRARGRGRSVPDAVPRVSAVLLAA